METDKETTVTEFSPLAKPSVTRTVLQRHGLATKKALGQNFLVSDAIIGKICELSEVCGQDDVLEVGPGIGTLTVALLPRANRVLSVERDRDLPAVLAETCGAFDNFTLLQKDALDLREEDFACVPGDPFAPNKFVANLPYAVAATLVLDYFQKIESIQSATVMVQSEVADRMSAKPATKEYGAYTVKLQLIAKPTGRFQVSPNNFFPPPHVTSSVIRLDRRDDLGVTPDEAAAASMMADAAFTQRRKTVANSMKQYFSRPQSPIDATDVPKMMQSAGIDARRRGETLGLEEFIELGRCLLRMCK